MEPIKTINAPLRDTTSIEERRFREAVCIDAARIYDSCEGKDCLEDLRVYFMGPDQQRVDEASGVRIKTAEVLAVFPELEPVPFNKGFYACDLSYYFLITCDLTTFPSTPVYTATGLAVFTKKVILYGGEGNVKIFSSQYLGEDIDAPGTQTRNLPKTVVQVAEPICLAARLCCGHGYRDSCGVPFIPQSVHDCFPVPLALEGGCGNVLLATIGIFTICQIERPVQMLVPAYDFCFPGKECLYTADNPCELFRTIDFPIEQFFPPKACECEEDRRQDQCDRHHH